MVTCHGGGRSMYARDSVNSKPRNDAPINGLERICIEIKSHKNKALLLLLFHGTDHLVTLLARLINWNKSLPTWIVNEKKDLQ